MWENENPGYTGAFSIELDLSEYEYFLVASWVDYQHSPNDEPVWIVHQKGRNDFSNTVSSYGYYWQVRWRNSTITDSGISFDMGKTSASSIVDNAYFLPKAIYGVKGCDEVMAFLSIANRI